MALVDWASAEPYLRLDQLPTNTRWVLAGSNDGRTNEFFNLFGLENEEWFSLTRIIRTSGAGTGRLLGTFPTPTKSAEFSFNAYIKAGSNLTGVADGTAGYTIFALRAKGGENAGYYATNTNTPSISIIRQTGELSGKPLLRVNGTSNVHSDVIPIMLKEEQLYCFTLRWTDQTGVGNNDGQIEVWANDDLLYSNNTFNFTGVDLSEAVTFIGNFIAPDGNLLIRDLMVFDEWTTAYGTAPLVKNVIEHFENTVDASPGYENSVVDTDVETVLNDDDDGTFIRALDPNVEMVLSVANPSTDLFETNIAYFGSRFRISQPFSANRPAEFSIEASNVEVGRLDYQTPGPTIYNISVGTNKITAPTLIEDMAITINSGQ